MSRYTWPSVKSGDDPVKRLTHLLTGGLDPAVLLPFGELIAALPPATPPDTHLWLPIGPSTVLMGFSFLTGRVAGRVTDLWVHSDGMRAYAGSASGGVWYSNNGGVSWSPVGNWSSTPGGGQLVFQANALSTGCLFVRFGLNPDGSQDEVYVGTGELKTVRSATPGGKIAGVGVLVLSVPLPTALGKPFENAWRREAAEEGETLVGSSFYRIAQDPDDPTRLVAATSVGLFTRQGTFAEHATWQRVKAEPFNFTNDARKYCVDVLWLKSPNRLYVALLDEEKSKGGLWLSNNGIAGPFTRITVLGLSPDKRFGLAARTPSASIVYVLGQGAKLWRADSSGVNQIIDLPDDFFGRDPDQSHYDLAIAVHPDRDDRIMVGGAAVASPQAALFKFTVTAPAPTQLRTGFQMANRSKPNEDSTWIGAGVHADVHAIRWISVGGSTHVWIACDGGVYRSILDGDKWTFSDCNAGLAVLECGFVANHPSSDACVFTGTQDNGTLLRIGDTVWAYDQGGDGGGVIVHPLRPLYYLSQSQNSRWAANNGGLSDQPVLRGKNEKSEAKEDKAASFYSTGDARQVGSSTRVRLALGTNRVWLLDNWDPVGTLTNKALKWVTLPGGLDPRAANPGDNGTDVLKDDYGAVITCRWVNDDVLLVLFERAVVAFTAPSAGVKWSSKVLSFWDAPKKHGPYVNGDVPTPTSPYLPPRGQWSDLAVCDPRTGSDATFYVATTGSATLQGNTVHPDDRIDTLWWYDGAGKWYPTGLREHGIKVPAYAVVSDPADTFVYVGTALGVWRAPLRFEAGVPKWEWEPFSNGLPATAVQDLTLFAPPGGPKLLRAALQARGIWEVDLTLGAPDLRKTFLRVHGGDTRRSSPAQLDPEFPPNLPQVDWRPDRPRLIPWYASPDLRFIPAPPAAGDPPPQVPRSLATAPIPALGWSNNSPDTYGLWQLQVAMHFTDRLVRPTGEWNDQFMERLKRDLPTSPAVVDAATWSSIVSAPAASADPWDGPEPTEADLLELVRERDYFTEYQQLYHIPTIAEVEGRRHRAYVMVHYRDSRALAAAKVRASLLLCDLPADERQFGSVALNDAWRARVVELMTDTRPAGWTLPTPWRLANAAMPLASPVSDIDARTPRPVRFELDFAPLTPGGYYLVLAIVHSEPDPVDAASLPGATVKDLVLSSHHVAARVVRRAT